MEGERQPLAVASATVSQVLDDDNLLIEILLRVAFPTSLVRAALVCRRWLHHASDHEFLSRFCKLHPPRILGFYLARGLGPRFIPMLPQPPEFAAVIRRGSFSLDTSERIPTDIRGCRNGMIFTTRHERSGLKHGVYSPWSPKTPMSTVPPPPCYTLQNDYYGSFSDILSVEEGDDLSFLYVMVDYNRERTKSYFQVHIVRPGDGVWHTHLTLATDQIFDYWDTKVVLIDNKIYMPCFRGDIVFLDLTTSSVSTIQLPQGVEYDFRDTMLSQANDASALCLIHAKDLQLCIWHHKGDNWLMADTICLHNMYANFSSGSWRKKLGGPH